MSVRIKGRCNCTSCKDGFKKSNSRSIPVDVVIEVEGTEEARVRGHVVIAIENPDPELQVKMLVGIVLIVLI